MTTETRALYQIIASMVDARLTCRARENIEWFKRHEDAIENLVREHLPSGSGFDSGTTIDLDKSTGEKLVFHTSYHHMTEHSYYDGWTEHDVVVIPSLIHKFITKITGRNRNDIKEHISETFAAALDIQVTL